MKRKDFYIEKESFIRARRDKRTLRGQKRETMVTDNYFLVNKQAIQGMHGIIFFLSFFILLLIIYIYILDIPHSDHQCIISSAKFETHRKICLCQKTAWENDMTWVSLHAPRQTNGTEGYVNCKLCCDWVQNSAS